MVIFGRRTVETAEADGLNKMLQCYYIQMLCPTITLYIATISTQASPPHPRSVELPPFVHPKHRTGNPGQEDQIPRAQRFGLENALQEGQVDDGHLAQEAAAHGEVEHPVAHDRHLPPQHAFALAAARHGVEHVEEDEAGECHGRVARGHGAVHGHFADVDDNGAEHDDGCRSQDALDQSAR